LSIGSAACQRGWVKRCQHRIGIGAPRQRIGIDPPVIGHLTNGSKNRMRIENSGCGRLGRMRPLNGTRLPAVARSNDPNPVDHDGPLRGTAAANARGGRSVAKVRDNLQYNLKFGNHPSEAPSGSSAPCRVQFNFRHAVGPCRGMVAGVRRARGESVTIFLIS
jgi:hypothetical protein